MTTAIEQAKREMYYALAGLKGRIEINYSIKDMLSGVDGFEHSLEEYLEQLRQQYEEMASTAHQRFESIQSLEAANQDLVRRLGNMTELRDMFRNLHQAATHASIERVGQSSTSGQDSGDLVSCAATAAWSGEGRPPAGVQIEMKHKNATKEWARPDFHEETLAWVGQETFVTIDEKFGCLCDYLFRPVRTPEQIAEGERLKAIDELRTNAPGIAWKSAAAIYDAGYRKQTCMHSFFKPSELGAIGDDQMKCTFCGVGK